MSEAGAAQRLKNLRAPQRRRPNPSTAKGAGIYKIGFRTSSSFCCRAFCFYFRNIRRLTEKSVKFRWFWPANRLKNRALFFENTAYRLSGKTRHAPAAEEPGDRAAANRAAASLEKRREAALGAGRHRGYLRRLRAAKRPMPRTRPHPGGG